MDYKGFRFRRGPFSMMKDKGQEESNMRTILLPLAALVLVPASANAQSTSIATPHVPGGLTMMSTDDARRDHIGRYSPADERFIGRLGAKVDLGALMVDQKRFARHYREAHAIAECMATPALQAHSFEEVVLARRECLGEGEAMDGLSLRAALAERRGGLSAAWPDRARSIDVDQVERFSGLVPGAKVDMTMIARCAAAYSPGMTATVLAGEPGDAKTEADALDRLYGATPECGLRKRPPGLSTTFQRAALAWAMDKAIAEGILASE